METRTSQIGLQTAWNSITAGIFSSATLRKIDWRAFQRGPQNFRARGRGLTSSRRRRVREGESVPYQMVSNGAACG